MPSTESAVRFIRFITRLLCVLLLCAPVEASRLFTTGFETNDFTATEWDTIADGAPTIATTSGCSPTVNSGTYVMRALQGATAAQNYVRRNFSAAKTTGTVSKRTMMCIADLPDTLPQSVFIWSNANGLTTGSGPVHVRIITGPKLRIRNQLTGTDTDGTTTLNLNQWYRVELKVTLSDTTGLIELRLNDAVEASQTNVDTLDGTAGFNRFFLGVGAGNVGSTSANYDVFFDDIAVNDETGTFQTNYPGKGKTFMVKPTSDNTVAWTKTGANCSATTNTDCVDDQPGTPDDLSGYTTIGTNGTVDRLNKTALGAEVPSDADMILIDVYTRFGASGSTGTRLCRIDLWDDVGTQTSGIDTGTGCDGTADTWALNRIGPTNDHLVFDLGTRSKATVNDADFDIGYTNRSAHNNRVTSEWGNVEWTEAPPAPACVNALLLLGAGCN